MKLSSLNSKNAAQLENLFLQEFHNNEATKMRNENLNQLEIEF